MGRETKALEPFQQTPLPAVAKRTGMVVCGRRSLKAFLLWTHSIVGAFHFLLSYPLLRLIKSSILAGRKSCISSGTGNKNGFKCARLLQSNKCFVLIALQEIGRVVGLIP